MYCSGKINRVLMIYTVLMLLKCHCTEIRSLPGHVKLMLLFLHDYTVKYVCRRFQVIKMNHDLSLTFNLTAAMFLVVWSPFFILSMVDLVSDMVNRKHNRSVNFGLRCTLLIIGSAKPVIYIICLRRFRDAWRCLGLSGDAAEAGTSSAVDQDTMTENKNTKSTKVAQISEKNVFLQDENRVFSPVFSTTQC